MIAGRLDRTPSEAKKHHLIGNALCLDFANTLYGHGVTRVHEYLSRYDDLVIWSHRAGVLDPKRAERLLERADRRAAQARTVFRRAIALRETIFRVFSTLANGATPQATDIRVLDSARHAALGHSRLARRPHGYVVDWDDATALDSMLWPIALSAGDLLTGSSLDRVRECSGSTCDWLFVDTSRNQLRRWCSMRECGNRAKARRFLERQRAQTPTGD